MRLAVRAIPLAFYVRLAARAMPRAYRRFAVPPILLASYRHIATHAEAMAPRLRGRRATGPMLLAALVATIALIALGVRALSDPGRGDARETAPGGETIIAKLAEAQFAQIETEGHLPEPTPVGRLLSMALSPGPGLAPLHKDKQDEPNLAGLSEIPRDLIWKRPSEKKDTAKPKAFAAFSKASEVLPWDEVEPVRFDPLGAGETQQHAKPGEQIAAHPPAPQLDVPTGEVGNWLKAKVTEIKGADRKRPLYHFELWLEPPADVSSRLVGVAYAFNTPAVRPQSQSSSDKASGFRISAGGLACADEITLTLRFDDGSAQTVAVDGCEIMS